ncbi:hypothetical protein AGDE_14789 [Angomonas deanei]|uniref:ADP-ribosylhydrolase ARH3 n=1 Tax=Angomonas deanei TaxID=59799 RepID=A0A7G2CQJ5_9TRYP|nr:hypothetical protein AGDE_14789 [Angomonas deanei]CAD2221254.1 ADP-ribosylglycohydrolase, putative [Angomonas deanei]|eukprot:EPY20211.1 hypothetical protein AGDE_14789 [Angomonas deanei]
MNKEAILDRAVGAIVGAFIGDALGMGVHWYYDLEEMRKDHGEWVSDYRDPKPGRYHDQLKAGELTQSGYILKLMLESLHAKGGYSAEHFASVLDEKLFTKMDGTPAAGPGGYTSQSIRNAYRMRQKGVGWEGGHCASTADTTEAIERNLALGVRYANNPTKLAEAVSADTLLTQNDEMLISMTVAFSATLSQLIRGAPMDDKISYLMMDEVKSGVLPFHCVTGDDLAPPKPGDPDPPRAGRFASPDALLTQSTCAAAAKDPNISIEPAWRVSLVYGMPCAAYHILPAAYYLAARFSDDFEGAVLHAVNGGGQNCARTMLTGALVGAQVGLQKIPQRFIDGLKDKDEILKLANSVAGQLIADM